MSKIYIASSWKNQHAVEMLTFLLRKDGHEVISWVENNYEEGYASFKDMGFEEWMKTESADNAFVFDTNGAMSCDLLIYVGPSGKDAAAECGIAWSRGVHMIGLFAKGEDFGLMRKLFARWFDRYADLIDYVNNSL
jgi:hypothetical protein